MGFMGIGLINRISMIKRGFIFEKSKPSFFIVGAQKSGATSLHSYLSDRKGFRGSVPKEVHYFDRDENHCKGNKWYEKHFSMGKRAGGSCLSFEATPTYLHRSKVPRRIYEYNPESKIIIILREPVSRAFSAWNMYKQWANEKIVPNRMLNDVKSGRTNNIYDVFFKGRCPSFGEYIDIEMELINEGGKDEEPSLLRRGLYKEQIERYVEIFGWHNVLVLGFNELKTDAEAVIRKCHDFLGVPYQEVPSVGEKEIKNKRAYPSKISSNELEILQKFYEQPNSDLFEYLGYRPDW